MQSYQDIKRAENMRKMFTKWLGAARTARRRRVTLQQCEEEMKHTRLLIVWDKWRERYQDIQLRPLAESFALQKQTNLVFYAFGIWHSKTRSLPAVRFNASHVKKKHWTMWRNAMPQALQSKKSQRFRPKRPSEQNLQKVDGNLSYEDGAESDRPGKIPAATNECPAPARSA